MNDAPDAATAALRALHHDMRGLPVRHRLWRIRSELPEMPLAVLETAWDPDATELLDLTVYLGIARACGVEGRQLQRIVWQYRTVEAARDGTPCPPAPHPERMQTRELYYRHAPATPPRTRLDPAWDAKLDTIKTRHEFMGYLRALKCQASLSYEQIARHTKQLDPAHPTPRSTLHDAMKRIIVPTDEETVRVLFTVLVRKVIARPLVPQRVEQIVQAWRRVLRDDPPRPIGSPAPSPPDIDSIVRDIVYAEHEAIVLGLDTQSGLAEALRIIRARIRLT